MTKQEQEANPKFWLGKKNKAIRYYYYLTRGLEVINPARYYVMAVFGIYFALKVKNILLLPLIFIGGLPILGVLGWLSVHHMGKVIEYLTTFFATHYSRYNIELQEKQLKLLEDISNELKTQKHMETNS